MFIKKIVDIENYRNLSNITLDFNSEINFVVGENNIGKTNLIEMLNKIISIGKFDEEDFTDVKESIKVVFQIEFDDYELGFFEDSFDIENEYSITIKAYQEDINSRIEYCHIGSESYIKFKRIKMLNFLYYSSLRMPTRELSFAKKIGTGKVLNYIMKKILESKGLENLDLINKNDVDKILIEVNDKFSKLNGLSAERIEAYLSDSKENIINRLIEIGDVDGRALSRLGDGLQYSFNVFLSILELLVNVKISKKEEEYDNHLIKNDKGDKYFPIIIALDEPEIHQHPYRQRALIKSIKAIVDNKDKNFNELVKDLFGFDGFI